MAVMSIDLPKRIYSPCEEVSGFVHLLLEKPVPRRSATLTLVGKEKTRVTYQSGENSCTAVEELEFLHQQIPVSLPEKQKGRIEPGEYNIPIKFILPPMLPPTYKGRAAKISYEIRAKIDVPHGLDINESSDLEVISDIRSFTALPIDIHSYLWNDQDSPGIGFTLERYVYGRGETLSGRCSFRNPRSKSLRKVDVALKWIENAKARGHRERRTILEQVAQVPLRGRIPKGESPFRILIPDGAPPTFEASLCSVRCLLHVSLDIALGRDVAADQGIWVVGSAGEGKPFEPYYADSSRGAGRNIPEKTYQPWYAGRTPANTWCYNCGTPIGMPDASYCPNCGSRLRMPAEDVATPVPQVKAGITQRAPPSSIGVEACIVCGCRLGQREDVVWCPHCGKLAHREHLLEWVRGKKACPACGGVLNPEYYE